MNDNKKQPHRVVIIGGGFGGMYAAKNLKDPNLQVTLIDQRNFHLFQPLLYQVATGGLSPGDIAYPLRSVLRKFTNTTVLQAKVTGLDPVGKQVFTSDETAAYDTLIVATGVKHHYFGNESWAPTAPGLKTIEDALDIRQRVLTAFENAELERDEAKRAAWLSFTIVGGGPTGVELAGALGELAHRTLKGEFRRIDLDKTRIIMIEGADQILPAYPKKLASAAQTALARLGVTVLTRTRVTHIQEGEVTIQKERGEERIRTNTVLWAAGVKTTSFAKILAEKTGAPTDRAGRIAVNPDLTIPNYPEILVIGDLASLMDEKGRPLPGVAPVAMQQGRYAAKLVKKRIRGQNLKPFRYHDKGSLAVIGRNAAVAQIGPLGLSGLKAWLIWAFVHIHYLIGFGSKALVSFQWAWSYITRKKGALLITDPTANQED